MTAKFSVMVVRRHLELPSLFYEIKYLILAIDLVRRYLKKSRSIFLCVCFFFLHFCDFRFYISNKQNAISKKKIKSPILLKIGMHFGKLMFKINAKFQRISNSHF